MCVKIPDLFASCFFFEVQAFLGRLCFARGAWTGTYENFTIALENLRASKTEQSLALIANFLSDYLLVKSKLGKEVKKAEVEEALILAKNVNLPHCFFSKLMIFWFVLNNKFFCEIFDEDSIRYAQTLEVVARVVR